MFYRFGKLTGAVKDYARSNVAAVAVAFGLMIPVVVTAVGVSVDLAQTYLVRERLAHALDAAALAAAAMASSDQDDIEAKVNDFVNANYSSDSIGAAYDIQVEQEGSELTVSAHATLDTAFMKVVGIDEVDVFAKTVVQRQVRGIEVVLVLDNTGSMSTNNNIGALKDASESFVNIMFNAAGDPDDVRIGLVPYSSSVNVGSYGLGLNPDGSSYGNPFVVPPENDIYKAYTNGVTPYSGNNYGIDEEDLIYDPTAKGQWHGCVKAYDYPMDTQDHEGPWEMYRYDWNGSWDSWYDNVYTWSPYITYGDYYNTYYGPNLHCPVQPVVPLSSDQEELLSAIDNMEANGWTLGNYGMVWGWRLISPEEPFTEGSEYDDNRWDKAVLMMTDGMNTMNHAYTAYGRTDEHSVRTAQENSRFLEVCEAMKENDILIYTVTFYSGVDEGTKEFYRNCATDESKYYDAPDQSDLLAVFEQISRELSNLHIKQ